MFSNFWVFFKLYIILSLSLSQKKKKKKSCTLSSCYINKNLDIDHVYNITSPIDFIFLMLRLNDYKNFSYLICKLKKKKLYSKFTTTKSIL